MPIKKPWLNAENLIQFITVESLIESPGKKLDKLWKSFFPSKITLIDGYKCKELNVRLHFNKLLNGVCP